MEQKRRRGGQPGNKNALKHGYYSRIFSKEEKKDFCAAGDVRGVDEEIALLRHVIRKAASSDNDRDMLIVVRATNALNRLVRTRHKIQDKSDDLNETVKNTLEYYNGLIRGTFRGSSSANKSFNNEQTNGSGNESELP